MIKYLQLQSRIVLRMHVKKAEEGLRRQTDWQIQLNPLQLRKGFTSKKCLKKTSKSVLTDFLDPIGTDSLDQNGNVRFSGLDPTDSSSSKHQSRR